MTPEQIEALGPAFTDYLRPYLYCCDYTQTFDLLGIYCRGLLSDAMLLTKSNAEKFRSSRAAQEDLARRQDS